MQLKALPLVSMKVYSSWWESIALLYLPLDSHLELYMLYKLMAVQVICNVCNVDYWLQQLLTVSMTPVGVAGEEAGGMYRPGVTWFCLK